MMARVWKSTILGVCALMLCGAAAAQSLKVGVLDNDRLKDGYTELKESLAALEAQIDARKQQLRADQANFRVKVKQFEARKDLITSDEEKRAKQQELMEEDAKLRKDLSEANDEIYKEQEKALKPFVAKIQAAVETVAKAQKLDLVLKRDDLAYFNPKLDITSEVVLELTKGSASSRSGQ